MLLLATSLLMPPHGAVLAHEPPAFLLEVTVNDNLGLVTSSPAGIDCGTDCSEDFTDVTTVTLTATPKPGAIFDGWNGACSGNEPECVVTKDAARFVSATFIVDVSVLERPQLLLEDRIEFSDQSIDDTFVLNDGSTWLITGDSGEVIGLVYPTGSGQLDLTIFKGTEALPNPNNGTKSNYFALIEGNPTTFFVEPLTDPLVVLDVTVNDTLLGTVTSSPGAIGIDCGTDCAHGFALDSDVTLTAEPRPGAIFAGWEGACEGRDMECTVTMVSAQSVTATFAIDTSTQKQPKKLLDDRISFSGQAIGELIVLGNGTVWKIDGASLESAVTGTGVLTMSIYSGAYLLPDPLSGTKTDYIMLIAGDPTTYFVSPLNEPLAALDVTVNNTTLGTVKSSLPGIDCGTDCMYGFALDSTVTLTATPVPGARFDGWDGACNGTELTCAVTMNGAQSVMANFSDDPSTPTPPPPPLEESNRLLNDRIKFSDQKIDDIFVLSDGSIWFIVGDTGEDLFVDIGGFPVAIANKVGSGQLSLTIFRGTDIAPDPNHGEKSDYFMLVEDNATVFFVQPLTAPRITLDVTTTGTRSGGVTSSPAGIDCGDDCSEDLFLDATVTLTATPGPGSFFVGWDGDCSGTAPTCELTMNAAQSVIAIFENIAGFVPLDVTINDTALGAVISAPLGIDCGTNCSESFLLDSTVTLTATPEPGALFVGWDGACEGEEPSCDVTMDDARSVTATFIIDSTALERSRELLADRIELSGQSLGGLLVLGDGSIWEITGDSGPIDTLSTIGSGELGLTIFTGTEVLPDPNSGEKSGYFMLVEGNPVTFFVEPLTNPLIALNVTTNDTSLGTVTSSPAGIDCGTDCAEELLYNTRVTLTATPESGALFVGWDGACDGEEPTCQLTMDAAQSTVAIFIEDPDFKALDVTINGTGLGSVTSSPSGIDCGADCSESFLLDATLTLTATPESGALFVGWEGACEGDDLVCELTMADAGTVSATFIIDSSTLEPSRELLTDQIVLNDQSIGDLFVLNDGSIWEITGDSGPLDSSNTLGSGQLGLTVFKGTETLPDPNNGDKTSYFALFEGSSTTFFVEPLTNPRISLEVVTNDTSLGSVTSNPAGIDCGTDCEEGLLLNNRVTLTATPEPGALFEGWDGACNGTGPTCELTMDAAQSVVASFAMDPSFVVLDVWINDMTLGSVTSSPNGIDCGVDCSERFMLGSTVTLTATPEMGAIFTGWDPACVGGGTICELTIDGEQSISATFDIDPSTLEPPIALLGGGEGIADLGQTLYYRDVGSFDPDGQVVSYFWALTGPCSSSDWNGNTSLFVDIDDYAAIEYPPIPCEVSLTITDNQGLTDRATSEVIVLREQDMVAMQEVYIAYYGRPADPDGLSYWGARLDAEDGNLDGLIAAYGTSEEYTTRFEGLTDHEMINALYQNLFGRDAEPAEMQWYITERLEPYRHQWTDENGGSTDGATEFALSRIALDILYGAQGGDRATIDNRVEVADYFTDQVVRWGIDLDAAALADAEAILRQVTSNVYTVNPALDAIDGWIQQQ